MSFTPTTQIRPDAMVDLLRAEFIHRDEPNVAWTDACSAFLALPGLRAFWPMSAVDYQATDQAKDLSGSGYHLTNNNTATFGYDDLAPYANFVSASSQYLSRADGGAGNWADITGTESYIVSGQRGLYVGGWFQIDDLAPGANNGFIGKFLTTGNERSYLIFFNDGDNSMRFTISVDGSATTTVKGPTLTTAQWYFALGRFDPSTALELFVNGTWYTNTTSIPASIYDSTADFNIGAYNDGGAGTYLDGRASMCFLGTCDIGDATVEMMYHWTRRMYGV